jgi:CRISPR-associated protein (TIGR02710 family)
LRELTSDPEIIEKLERYKQLVNGYSTWDKFDHRKALEILRTFDNSLINIDRNRKFLLEMERKEWGYDLMIPDLLNNAKRRMDEGKYDDAVARLYRTTELIAQHRLDENYGIKSSDVDLWKLQTFPQLEEKTVEKYEKMRDKDGKIKLSLSKDYELLNDLNDGMGKKFFDDQELKNLRSKRNFSILAHGLEPVKKEDAEKMFQKVKKEYAKTVIEDFDDKIKKSEFVEL